MFRDQAEQDKNNSQGEKYNLWMMASEVGATYKSLLPNEVAKYKELRIRAPDNRDPSKSSGLTTANSKNQGVSDTRF